MQINEIKFDATTKDFVCITNGIPIKDDDGKETKELDPTEGIVFRHVLGDGFYWSYISIKGHFLRDTRVTKEEWRNEMDKSKGRI